MSDISCPGGKALSVKVLPVGFQALPLRLGSPSKTPRPPFQLPSPQANSSTLGLSAHSSFHHSTTPTNSPALLPRKEGDAKEIATTAANFWQNQIRNSEANADNLFSFLYLAYSLTTGTLLRVIFHDTHPQVTGFRKIGFGQ